MLFLGPPRLAGLVLSLQAGHGDCTLQQLRFFARLGTAPARTGTPGFDRDAINQPGYDLRDGDHRCWCLRAGVNCDSGITTHGTWYFIATNCRITAVRERLVPWNRYAVWAARNGYPAPPHVACVRIRYCHAVHRPGGEPGVDH